MCFEEDKAFVMDIQESFIVELCFDPMLFEISFVVLALVFCLVITQKKKRRLRERSLLLEPMRGYFGKSEGEELSIHQYLLKLTGHESVRYMCAIITLPRDFCLSGIFSAIPDESVIFVGQLKVLSPCVYIFKKEILLKHYGLKYARKYLLENIPGYKIFGTPEEKHICFVKKYAISVFFISYLPGVIEDKPELKTRVFLKGSLNLIDRREFVNDLMCLFADVKSDSSKRISELEHGCRKDMECVRAREGRSFTERLAIQMREKNKLNKEKKYNKG